MFDVCVNCSGSANVSNSITHPRRDFLLNTANVFSILDAIREYNPECKFLNISSAAVYGRPVELPIGESCELNPISPYGTHKKLAEEICSEFFNYFNIKTCSIRIFSAFGPGLKKQLFWDIYKKSKIGNEIKLFGDGKESRDFIYIQDIVVAVEKIVNNADFKGECINVSSGIETTIKEAAETFINIINPNIKIVFNNIVREGDPKNWKANINKIKSIGFAPKIFLKEGLTNYYQWLTKEKL